MLILRKPFSKENLDVMYRGCGCDIYTPGGDCKFVDDGGCGCDH